MDSRRGLVRTGRFRVSGKSSAIASSVRLDRRAFRLGHFFRLHRVSELSHGDSVRCVLLGRAHEPGRVRLELVPGEADVRGPRLDAHRAHERVAVEVPIHLQPASSRELGGARVRRCVFELAHLVQVKVHAPRAVRGGRVDQREGLSPPLGCRGEHARGLIRLRARGGRRGGSTGRRETSPREVIRERVAGVPQRFAIELLDVRRAVRGDAHVREREATAGCRGAHGALGTPRSEPARRPRVWQRCTAHSRSECRKPRAQSARARSGIASAGPRAFARGRNDRTR